jgi:hypothetical protein
MTLKQSKLSLESGPDYKSCKWTINNFFPKKTNPPFQREFQEKLTFMSKTISVKMFRKKRLTLSSGFGLLKLYLVVRVFLCLA